ncbi:uncharacterized protein LOC127799890 isoform X2 [Diospyros lotus]|nr:uncharacterized protein LOC127799890 isoform X2 [Diospyros lotus]
MVKCSVLATNTSKNSDLSNLAASTGGLAAFWQSLNNGAFPQNQNTRQKLVDELSFDGKQRNAQENCNFLHRGLIGASQNYMSVVSDNLIPAFSVSGSSTVSKFISTRDTDNGCQSNSTYTDSISQTGQSFMSHHLQNSKTIGNNSDVSLFYGIKEGGVVDRDAVSSSIELRLGQPSPQSQTLGNSVFPASRSPLLDPRGDPQRSFLPQQLIHNCNSNMVEEHSQYLQHTAGSSNFSARRGQSTLNFVNHAPGVNTARDSFTIEQLTPDADRSVGNSVLLSQFKTPVDQRMHSKAATGGTRGIHVMPRKPHHESRIAKYDLTNIPYSRNDASETELSIIKLDLQKHRGEGKGVAFIADGLCVPSEPNFEFRTKHVDSSTNCNRVGRTGQSSCSMAHGKSSHPCQFSGLHPEASDGINAINHSGKIPGIGFHQQLDHVFLRSTSFPMDSGPTLPRQPLSVGNSGMTSFGSIASSAFSNKEATCTNPLLDDNLRMLAFGHILSNQGHSNASPVKNQDQGRLHTSCSEKMLDSIFDASSSKERQNGLPVNREDASGVAIKSFQSGFTHWVGGDAESLAPVAGLSKCCSFSTFSPGTSLHGKNIEMQCQLTCDLHQHVQPMGSSTTENDIATSNEHGKCCQRTQCAYLPGQCGCNVQANCLGGNSNSDCETFPIGSKEQTATLCGMASALLSPNFKEDSSFSKEKAVSFYRSGHLGKNVKPTTDCHTFQWRDVPSKVTGIHNLTCKDQPIDLLDRRENLQGKDSAAAKCFDRSAQGAESLKEQEVSNISSGCSAPAVTQASVEINNVDAVDEYKQNIVVDEGSGIDKCWSSDDPPESERSSEVFDFVGKINSTNEGSSKPLPNQSSRTLIEELRFRDSLLVKHARNQVSSGLQKNNLTESCERVFQSTKRKRPTKWKNLDESFAVSGFSPACKVLRKCTCTAPHCSSAKQMWLQPDERRSWNCACSVKASFRQRSVLCLTKAVSHKRGLRRLYCDRERESSQIQLNVDVDCLQIPETSSRKRLKLDQCASTIKQFRVQEPNCLDSGNVAVSYLADCMFRSSTEQVDICNRKVRPVVCGKYGVISNGNSLRPTKILPLRKILKASGRCKFVQNGQSKLSSARKSEKRSMRGSNTSVNKFSNLKEKGSLEDTECKEFNPESSIKGTDSVCFPGGKEHDDVPCTLEKGTDNRNQNDHRTVEHCLSTRLKPKCKEVRKRSLYELSTRGIGSSCLDVSATKGSRCTSQTNCRYLEKLLKDTEAGKYHAGEAYGLKSNEGHQCQSSISDLDAFCCVCGSSNKDEINCLLECSRCLIRVHQACYGVSKVPRGHWYCRPCRASCKDIVCVLCGYGAGAMTRALRSHNIVKSLLKAWNISTDSGPKDTVSASEDLGVRFRMLSSSTSGFENDLFPVIRSVPMQSSAPVWKVDLLKGFESVKVQNSITAGVLDSTVKQWVHMVCGLWTPGTRCPNVDTMSAFDVSGASRPKGNVVCSLCNRPGGSCIQCRVGDCSVRFHPWCAHQKGLLQSEVEGIDNESVGFYGRCKLHVTYPQCDSGDPVGAESSHPGEKEYSCARTEGYKGRKREGYHQNPPSQSSSRGGCVVPQEQLNAWLHINRQKSCTDGLPKLKISDVEYDCRKEYIRYKQSKGWENLVVYKSGIHALGLYTSQFIPRAAMVVEYVGEIVGVRVADKRENEYQSGRKLQYKSACYFFRIDKEHIIDATRKGGIARFVNHSCLPNCVAKVISVRNEKKVVFFAERDIYPGEEITYDYHFNHEDEGKKIPCFCNSKNCRRYLN